MTNYSCSLVISVYNQARQLELVLDSVARQTVSNFEIIVADDGSADDLSGVISRFQQCTPTISLRHIRHDDKGFYKTIILNKAFRMVQADYIVVIDGDMLLHPEFIENHLLFSRVDRVLCGYRGVKLGPAYTEKLLAGKASFSPAMFDIFRHGLKGDLQRPFRGMVIRNPLMRRMLVPARLHLSGCNFSLYRDALESVNGMDESILEYGFEDFEMGHRLLRSGYVIFNVSKYCNTYHLHHGKGSKKDVKEIKQRIVASTALQCRHGIGELEQGSSVSDFITFG